MTSIRKTKKSLKREIRRSREYVKCDYTDYPLAVYECHEYLVQKRHKFLGISYWRNVAKTTKFNFAKKAYCKLCDFKGQTY